MFILFKDLFLYYKLILYVIGVVIFMWLGVNIILIYIKIILENKFILNRYYVGIFSFNVKSF